MHFYKFNIKDYAVNTTHLTNDEDLAYRRLLDLYYTEEQAIANDYQKLSRRLRIAAEVIEVVLNEFFVLTENGWICGRVEEEIQSYHRLCGKRKELGVKGAQKRYSKRTARVKQEPSKGLAIATIPLTTNHYITPISPQGDEELELDCEESSAPEHPVLTRLRDLFRMKPGTDFDASTHRAWQKNKKSAAALPESDWALLAWAYRQTEGDAARYRRRDPATLLNNLLAEVLRAREWAKAAGVNPTATRPRPAEPEGWQDIITSTDPSYNCTTWFELPESLRAFVRERVAQIEAENAAATAAA